MIYRESILRMKVTEPLDIVKYQPGKWDDHQDYKGNAHEQYRSAARWFSEMAQKKFINNLSLF